MRWKSRKSRTLLILGGGEGARGRLGLAKRDIYRAASRKRRILGPRASGPGEVGPRRAGKIGAARVAVAGLF
jgi:hypothetical protein